jgi:hypothetical protein
MIMMMMMMMMMMVMMIITFYEIKNKIEGSHKISPPVMEACLKDIPSTCRFSCNSDGKGPL